MADYGHSICMDKFSDTIVALSGIDAILLLSLVSHGVIALALYVLVLALRHMK